MNVYAIINGINSLCAFVIICLILIRRPTKALHLSALFWYTCLFSWTFTYFFWGFQTTKEGSAAWLHALLYTCCLIHLSYFHFLLEFCNRTQKYKKYLFFGYISSAALIGINFVDGYVDWSYIRSFPPFHYWPHATSALAILIGIEVYFVLLCGWVMIKTISENQEPARSRIKLFYVTSIGAWLGGLINWFPFYDVTPVPPFGNLLVTIYMIAGFYLLYKHDILGLNIVIKRTFTYALLTLFITLVFTLFIIVSERIFQRYLGYNSIVATLFAATTITLLFNPVRGLITAFIDKQLFGTNIENLSTENSRMKVILKDQDKMRAVATLAAGMAHEIKNPLTAIQTFAEYLPSKYDDPDFRDRFQRIMLQEVKRANGIVSQVLEFAKPRHPVLSKINLQTLIDDTLEFMSADFIKQNIQIIRNYSEVPLVLADAHQIRQVVLNLFINSLKAMPHGGQLVLSIRADSGDSSVTFSVKDTGKGILKEHLPHIFEPFYSASSDGGSGLGLAIVYNIIKEHGGTISVTSEPGRFTQFDVRLKTA